MNAEAEHVMAYVLRPMVEADITQATQVDRDAFPENGFTPPFKRDLRERRIAHYLVAVASDALYDDYAPEHGLPSNPDPEERIHSRNRGFGGVVRRLLGVNGDASPATDELIGGYLGLWAVIDEGHVTSVGVREPLRGNGIGELLIIGAVETSKLLDCRKVTLEVRVSNDVAQNLYRKYGFKVVGRRKRYYSDNGEDAYIMTTDPIDTPDYDALLLGLSSRHSERWGVSFRTYEQSDDE